MLKIGIIGAGSITERHILNYQANPCCEVVSIADINPAQAQKTAEKFGIRSIFTDYKDILNSSEIDAVSICTPTFTHKDIALDAIEAHKHILCEKPPALNADEAAQIQSALIGYDKVFMLGLVRRFDSKTKYLKEYIDSGKMGKIICAEAVRLGLMSMPSGWFAKRSLGGGSLIDGAIHELDLILYLMGYPKPKTVMAFESHANSSLAGRTKSKVHKNINFDEGDIEDFIKGFVNFENGTNLYIKSGGLLLSDKTGCYCEINGEKAGAIVESFSEESPVKILEVTDNLYLNNSIPHLPKINPFEAEINHFVDCCVNGTQCMATIDQGVMLMEIIDAIYKSAETGSAINL